MSDKQHFAEWLSQKKISFDTFSTAMPQVFKQWQIHFEELGPSSFYQQYRFKLNQVRRQLQGLASSRPDHYEQSANNHK